MNLSIILSLIVAFSAIARGAQDIWAGTLVTLAVTGMLLYQLVKSYIGKSPLSLPLLIPTFIFTVVLSCSYVNAANPWDSFLSLTSVLCSILILLTCISALNTQGDIDLFFMFLIPVLWIEALLSGAQGIIFHFQDFYQRVRYLNPVATYFLYNANQYCGSLVNANLLAVFALPFIFPYIYKTINEWKNNRTRAYFFLSGAISAAACIVFAKSGSGVICFLAGAIFMMREDRRIKKYMKHAVVFSLLVVAGVVLYKYMHGYDRRLDPLRNPNNRFYWWASSFHVFLDHPAFGIGLGGFPSAYLSYKIGGTENTLYTHDLILTLLAETGLTGLIAFGILIWSFYKNGLSGNKNEFVWRAIVPAFVALALFYTFNFGYEYFINMMVLAIFAGIVLSSVESPRYRIRLSALIICFAVSFGALTYAITPFFASRHLVDGISYLQEKNWALAQKHFEIAREIDDQSWESYAGLAKVAFFQGDFEKAIKMQAEALKRNRLSVPLKREFQNYQLSSQAH